MSARRAGSRPECKDYQLKLIGIVEHEQREGTMVRPTSPLFTLSALLALCLANVAAKTGGGGIRGVRALVRLRIFAFMKSRRNLCRIEFEQYQVGTTYAESNFLRVRIYGKNRAESEECPT